MLLTIQHNYVKILKLYGSKFFRRPGDFCFVYLAINYVYNFSHQLRVELLF